MAVLLLIVLCLCIPFHYDEWQQFVQLNKRLKQWGNWLNQVYHQHCMTEKGFHSRSRYTEGQNEIAWILFQEVLAK